MTIITKTILLILIILLNIVSFFTYSQENTLHTDYFISGGGMAGTSSAIQFAKLNKNFLLQSETEWIGGQPTAQGVTSFDEHGKLFQRNSVYETFKTGVNLSSRLPVQVDENINSQLKGFEKNILKNTRIIDVNKQNGMINFVTLQDKTGKQFNVKAKFYLDSSDFADLTIKSGTPYKIGIDSTEETKETQTLTNEERDKFLNGFTVNGKNFAGFGNRIQPLTHTAQIIDKGYNGTQTKYNLPVANLEKRFFVNTKGINKITFILDSTLTKENTKILINDINQPFEILSERGKTLIQLNYDFYQVNNRFKIVTNQTGNLEALIQTPTLSTDYKYYDYVIDNMVTYNNQYQIDNLETGTFNLEILNNNNFNLPVDIKIRQDGNVIYEKTENFNSQSKKDLLSFFSKGGTFRISLKPQCAGYACIGAFKVLIRENAPKNYNLEEFGAMITDKNFNRPFLSFAEKGTFFLYRLNIPNANIQTNKYLSENLKTIASYRTLGVTQLNTPYNDFEIKDVNRFYTDYNYRVQELQEAKEKTARYYYFLKYDLPKENLGCLDGELFCNGKRIMLVPDLMGTQDGFAQEAYIRETPRAIGENQLTYRDLAWNQNPCESKPCTDLEIRSYKNDGVTYSSNQSKVDTAFLQEVPNDSIGGFYYPTDSHSFFMEKADQDKFKAFLEYLKQRGKTEYINKPVYFQSLFNTAVKSGTMRLSYLYNKNTDNLLFCGKNISQSQIANGSTRLHPGESMIGQACSIIASTLADNNQTRVSDTNSQNLMRKIQMTQIDNGMLPLPIEDTEISEMRNAGINNYNKAIINLVLDGVFDYDVSQNPKYQYVLLKTVPKKPVTKDELKKFLDRKEMEYKNIDSFDGSINSLESIIGTEKYQFLLNKISELKTKTKTLPSLKEPENNILQRVELATML